MQNTELTPFTAFANESLTFKPLFANTNIGAVMQNLAGPADHGQRLIGGAEENF